LNTPLLEAPDAYYHFAVIEYLARTGTFPPSDHAEQYPWHQAVFHAPLYYMISAWLIKPINTQDFPSSYPRNPHVQLGLPGAVNNRNFVAHVGDPLHDTGLAVRVVEGFSMALGVVTLGGVFALVKGLLPTRPGVALLAVLIVLLNPQFLFISSAVNNDNLVTALTCVSLALLVWMIRRGVTGWNVGVLAPLLALNSLSKASGLALYPVAALGIAWICWRQQFSLLTLIRYGLILMLIWLVIAGWWYFQNVIRYGDPTATYQLAQATGLRVGDVQDVVGELRGLYFSFWGLFGWFNIIAPLSFYHWTVLLVGLGGVGMIMGLIRRRFHIENPVMVGLLVLHGALIIGTWWQYNRLVPAAQGRVWFPLLGIFAGGIAWGLREWRWRAIPLILLSGMAFAAISFPFTLITPAYAPPEQWSVQDWNPPPDAVPMHFREPWNEAPCLTLWTLPAQWDHSVAPIRLTLTWQTTCQMTGYWSLFVHFSDLNLETCRVGDNRHVLAQLDTMPAGGNLPLPAFRPGYVWQDMVEIKPPDGIDYHKDWYLQVGLYDAGGTFIRAFVSEDERHSSTDTITIGRCSPELVNIALR
jgi:4-amino-4-deoxy-L-arabinose transferase-like glycosyltransferase